MIVLTFNSGTVFLSEMVGTALLILMGCGVVAGVLLAHSKAQNSGWIVITFGWGLGVMIGAASVADYGGASLNPAVTVGIWAAGGFDSNFGDKIPIYFAGEFVRRVHRRHAGVSRLLPALEGHRGPGPQAGRVLDRPGGPQLRLEPGHRDHRHVRAGVRHLRRHRQLGHRPQRHGHPLRCPDRRRHRPLAGRADGVRHQPGARPRAAHHPRDPAHPGQGLVRLGVLLGPGRRAR